MPKTVIVRARISPEDLEALKARAELERRPLASLIALLLKDAINQNKPTGDAP